MTPGRRPKARSPHPDDSFTIDPRRRRQALRHDEAAAPNTPTSKPAPRPDAGRLLALRPQARPRRRHPAAHRRSTPPCPRACSPSSPASPTAPTRALAAAAGKTGRAGAGRPELPGRLPGRHRHRRRRRRPDPVLRRRQRLPRRPLQRRAALPGGDHPGGRRALRPRHVVVRNALYVDPETTQVRAVSDPFPSILAGHPARHPLDRGQPRPARLHPQPDHCDPLAITGVASRP